jgi:2-polyprenyl-3-methyl-5-hydroxy-6-metoxy-1,4-benzoquinol methylase
MEVKEDTLPAWLDRSHPNFLRWEKSRKLALERGEFVKSIIEKHINCSELQILDLGSGEGGTSAILSRNNSVVSFDLSLIRLKRQKGKTNFPKINGDALNIPFKSNKFDLIILQDVIEHVSNVNLFVKNLKDILKTNGTIYLSTPNKFSLFNLIADPHWGLPIASVLKRDKIRKYFLKRFRGNEIDRKDIAQLLSLKDLKKYFSPEFEITLKTKYSVQKLFEGNKGIVWSDFHLFLIRAAKSLYLDKMILKIANDTGGFINKFLTPTFYLILKRID